MLQPTTVFGSLKTQEYALWKRHCACALVKCVPFAKGPPASPNACFTYEVSRKNSGINAYKRPTKGLGQEPSLIARILFPLLVGLCRLAKCRDLAGRFDSTLDSFSFRSFSRLVLNGIRACM